MSEGKHVFVQYQKKTAVLAMLTFIIACAPAPKNELALEVSSTSAHIIGGSDVVSLAEPAAQSTVIIYDTASKSLCTGSLLGNNLVLTAAHCLGQDPRKAVIIFALNIAKANQTMARPVVGAIAHSLFAQARGRRTADVGDIALIKYQGTTPVGYRPATLLPNVSVLRNGIPTVIAGYGMSDGITKRGSGTLRHTVTTIANTRFATSEVQVEQRQGRGACHGDSGGPAFVVANGIYYLWGITSRGSQDPKDQCNGLSIHTNILFYAKWVQDSGRILAQNNQFNFSPTERTFGRGADF